MRTTLTIDEDLMVAIKEKVQAEKMSYKEVINRAIRAGISMVGDRNPNPYTCRSFSLGIPREVDLDHTSKLVDALQDEEITRKLQLKK
jgi:hypothetical protein